MYPVSLLVLVTVVCLCQSLPLNDVLAPQTLGKNESFWRECGTKHVKINDIEIEGCDGTPCKIRKGTNITVTIKFTPDQSYKDLINMACADMQVACVSFVFPNARVCNDLVNATCPMEKKREYTEKVVFPMKEGFPTVRVSTRWTIDDPYRQDEMEACFMLDLDIS